MGWKPCSRGLPSIESGKTREIRAPIKECRRVIPFGYCRVVLTTIGMAVSLVACGTLSGPDRQSPVARASSPSPHPKVITSPSSPVSLPALPVGTAVYSDPLSSPRKGWPPKTGPGFSYQYEQGGFSMRSTALGERWAAPMDMPPEPGIIVEVTTAVISGSENASGGPVCVPANLTSYYSFVVDAAGTYSVHAHPNGNESPIVDTVRSTAMHTGIGATNRVAAACLPQGASGVRLMMSINGVSVFDQVDPGAPAGPWIAGISSCWCYGLGDIRFQDIVEQRVTTV